MPADRALVVCLFAVACVAALAYLLTVTRDPGYVLAAAAVGAFAVGVAWAATGRRA